MKTKIAVVIIVKRWKNILMYNRWKAQKYEWTVLWWHLNYWETIFDCWKREVKEEANIEIQNLKFLTILENITNERHYISYYILADYKNWKIIWQKQENINNLNWFHINELPDDLYEPFKIFLSWNTINWFSYLNLKDYVS